MIKLRGQKAIAGRTAKATGTLSRVQNRVPPRTSGHVPRTAPRRAPRATGAQVCLGEIVRWDPEGPLVDFPGNDKGPLRARVSGTAPGVRVAPSPSSSLPSGTALGGHEVVLLVDPRPGRSPVLLGFLTPIIGGPAGDRAGDGHGLEARIDGRRVELEGRDEIVLRCGEASITLRRNGRIAIRGVDVETRAAGVNRIKGGTVNIN